MEHFWIIVVALFALPLLGAVCLMAAGYMNLRGGRVAPKAEEKKNMVELVPLPSHDLGGIPKEVVGLFLTTTPHGYQQEWYHLRRVHYDAIEDEWRKTKEYRN